MDKKVHFIWYQGINKIPPNYLITLDKFKKINHDFEIKIWDEKTLGDELQKTTNKIFKNALDKCKFFIQKIDIYKWLILFNYGGFYMDLDIDVGEPIDTMLLDFNNYELVLSKMQVWSYIPYYVVNNGIIWAKQNSSLIPNIVDSIEWHQPFFKNKDWLVLDTTGPFHLSRWAKKNHKGLLILDDKYFEGRPLVYISDSRGMYITHLHDSKWMDNWLHIYIFLLKNLFFLIGFGIAIYYLQSQNFSF